MKQNSPHRPWVMGNVNMIEQQKSELWRGYHSAATLLHLLLKHDLDETVKLPDSISAAATVEYLTGLPVSKWVGKRGQHEWIVRDLIRELRDDIRGRFIRLFINPTPELFDAAVPGGARCSQLNLDRFMANGHDENDFAEIFRRVVIQAEHGEVCFMLDGSAQNIGKLWADILEPFCRLLMAGLIYSPKQVSNLTLILLSDDPAERVLSRCICECMAIGVRPHIEIFRYITDRLLGVLF